MHFTYSLISDIGIRREVNQDAIVVLEAETEKGPVICAAVCDGMGGLEHGEVAAGIMTEELKKWFQSNDGLASVIYSEDKRHSFGALLNASLEDTLLRADHLIYLFSQKNNVKCGTTVVVLLLFRGMYYIVNVGDSRAYLFRKRLIQITKDQTVTQRRLDNGEITEKMAKFDKDRAVLLQCIGMNLELRPEYKSGRYNENDYFLLCSDGFRNKISADEIEQGLREDNPVTKTQMKDLLMFFVEENKRRRETDNISAVLLKVGGQ